MINLLVRILLFLGGGEKMQVFVTVYVTLILAGRRTIDEVPENIREEVRADLEALDYDFGE